WTDTGWPATMEGAVRSGNRAAAAVRQQLAEGASREGAAA
ncbi:MAG: FAD-dependent oxidoreductase, partial [Ilumatobacteraceae bacterium]